MEKLKHFFKSQYFIFAMLITIKAVAVHGIIFNDFNIIKAFLVEGAFIFLLLGWIEFLPKKLRSPLYFFMDIILTAFFAALILYTSYFNTIPTYYALFQLGQVSAISDSVIALVNPYYLFMFIDVFVLTAFRLIKKMPYPKAAPAKRWSLSILGCAFIASLVLFTYYKGVYIANPVLAAESKGILNYELLNFYKDPTADIKKLDPDVSAAELNKKIRDIKGIEQIKPDDRTLYGAAKGRNVIVLQLESFQNFLINLEVGGEEVTPNLNKLLGKSRYFDHIYQENGPGNTSDAEFMMNTSLFPTSYSAVSIAEGSRDYPSLPKLLGGLGYESMTFHADDLAFWNRDELYPSLGFDHWYERPEYGEKDIIGMGPSDDVLYNVAIKKLKAAEQPFYAQVISMSSHHPYKIPESKQTLTLPAKYKGNILGDYLEAQHYTDAALGRFIDDLKTQGLWDNSVILIYGDHFGLDDHMLGNKGQALMKELIGHPYTKIDRYNIPFIIAAPGITEGAVDHTIGGQIDFLPTLTNLLGVPIDKKLVHFGQDLINHPDNLAGMRYYMPEGSFINQNIIFEPKKDFSDGSALDLNTGQPVPYKKYKKDYERIIKLEHLSDAYILSRPEREQ